MDTKILLKTKLSGVTIPLDEREIGFTAENKVLWVGNAPINPPSEFYGLQGTGGFTPLIGNDVGYISVSGRVVTVDLLMGHSNLSNLVNESLISEFSEELAPQHQINGVAQYYTSNGAYGYSRVYVSTDSTIRWFFGAPQSGQMIYCLANLVWILP